MTQALFMKTLQTPSLRNLSADPVAPRQSGANRSTLGLDPADFASLLRQKQTSAPPSLHAVAALTAPAPAPNPTPSASLSPAPTSASAASSQLTSAAPPAAAKPAPMPTATATSATNAPHTASASAAPGNAPGSSAQASTAGKAGALATGKTGGPVRKPGAPDANSAGTAGAEDGTESVSARRAGAKQAGDAAPGAEPSPPWLAELQQLIAPTPPSTASALPTTAGSGTGTDTATAMTAAAAADAKASALEARGQNAPLMGGAPDDVRAAGSHSAPAHAANVAPDLRDMSRDVSGDLGRYLDPNAALPRSAETPGGAAAAAGAASANGTGAGAAAGSADPAATSFAALLSESRGLGQASVAPSAPGRGASLPVDTAAVATSNAAEAAAAAAAAATPTRSLQAAVAPTVVRLAAAVTEPEFAQALGVQISVLASAGVQRAELHLNPADLGPVSVQILLDGKQARVDFGADVAATRAAIEAGLPALAAALSDAGFTLSGGGVSQQSRNRGDAQDGGRSAQSDAQSGSQSGSQSPRRGDGSGSGAVGTDDANGAMRAGARRTVTLGGLDLYA